MFEDFTEEDLKYINEPFTEEDLKWLESFNKKDNEKRAKKLALQNHHSESSTREYYKDKN